MNWCILIKLNTNRPKYTIMTDYVTMFCLNPNLSNLRWCSDPGVKVGTHVRPQNRVERGCFWRWVCNSSYSLRVWISSKNVCKCFQTKFWNVYFPELLAKCVCRIYPTINMLNRGICVDYIEISVSVTHIVSLLVYAMQCMFTCRSY
jgi:hypothetical protein